MTHCVCPVSTKLFNERDKLGNMSHKTFSATRALVFNRRTSRVKGLNARSFFKDVKPQRNCEVDTIYGSGTAVHGSVDMHRTWQRTIISILVHARKK